MAYLIFSKENKGLYKIFEDDNELNNSTVDKNLYEVKTVANTDFKDVQYNIKGPELDNQNNITYIIYSTIPNFGIQSETQLLNCFYVRLNCVGDFLSNNKNHPDYIKWQNFYNTLNKYINNKSLLNNITYPINLSFEQFLQSKGESILNILQLP